MKRRLLASALALLLLALCACQTAAPQGSQSPAPSQGEAQPTPAGPDLSEEPPLDAADLARPAPDFLTQEQQQLYRRACNFYVHLFGGNTAEVEYSEHLEPGTAIPDPGQRESVTLEDYTYLISYGRYADYELFDAVRRSLFTDSFWASRNILTGELPLFTQHEGKLCYVDAARGSGYYRNEAFPDTFALVSQSEDEIVFTVTGYYLEIWPPQGTSSEEWDAYRQENYGYTLDFTLKLVNTPEGWRFDQFAETTADEQAAPQ